ncbi:hypothetical protein ACE38W_12805 [Chitinophaga sp. Hz27]|uniref:hypothetical protein n=1 Tax=Chitinophaga sp. Hz27 TaxID=3347169 RepID=UPI0035D910C2
MHILADTIPYQVNTHSGQFHFEWLDAGKHPFNAPFFHDTIQQLKQQQPRTFRSFTCISTPEEIIELSKLQPGLEPAAFVFHISRCGSTTISQMLAEDSSNVVLSEIEMLDSILRSESMELEVTFDRENLFKAVVSLLSRRRLGTEERLFIKLDSWHLFYYELLRSWYPHTPFILLYRHPMEVVRSQMNQHGFHFFRGMLPASLMNCSWDDLPLQNPEYISWLITRYLEKITYIHASDSNARLVNYKAGNEYMLQSLLEVAAYMPDAALQQRMLARTRFHAKYPTQLFTGDPEITDIPSYMLEGMSLYQQLDEIKQTRIISPIP